MKMLGWTFKVYLLQRREEKTAAKTVRQKPVLFRWDLKGSKSPSVVPGHRKRLRPPPHSTACAAQNGSSIDMVSAKFKQQTSTNIKVQVSAKSAKSNKHQEIASLVSHKHQHEFDQNDLSPGLLDLSDFWEQPFFCFNDRSDRLSYVGLHDLKIGSANSQLLRPLVLPYEFHGLERNIYI